MAYDRPLLADRRRFGTSGRSPPPVNLGETGHPKRNKRTASRSSRHVAGRPRSALAQTRERRALGSGARGATFEVPYH